jgi:hypothetical protein
MIEACIAASADSLAARLARKAAALAVTAIARRRLSATDPARWRNARLLWPLFAKD